MLNQIIIAFTLLIAATFGLPLTEDRILGGDEATPGQFPHQVSLRIFNDNQANHICGGSIISERFILTAAHCYLAQFPNVQNYRVVLGAHFYNSDDGKSYDIIRIIPHEEYDHPSLINDIALMEVNETIVFNDRIAPISINREFFGADVPAVASGWGRTIWRAEEKNITNLQYVHVNTLSNEDCRRRTENEPDARPIHDNQTICVYSGRNGTGMCGGDSGGPLMYDNQLIGVFSWVFFCARGLPDGFARISVFADWITEHMK